MKVLIIGSGGREHVLAWKIKQSSKVAELYSAPGNGGIAEIAECINIKADDVEGLLRFAKDKQIDLAVVGPEAPLVVGLVDEFEKAGIKVFGPSKQASQLEGSKIFSKEFMVRHGVPTAAFNVFSDVKEAKSYLNDINFPVVIKADGLAAGKGVLICQNLDEGNDALEQIMVQKAFKDAGKRVLIEECLVGQETSILAISDGHDFVVLETSQDHKRIFDDDIGPNTGGMGAYSPANIVTQQLLQDIVHHVIAPTIKGMEVEGNSFKGVLYAGIMLTSRGPMVLEYNVRFGDPEAQAVLPRLKTDIVDVMLASCDGTLSNFSLSWDDRPCVCVVMSSGGYPAEYEKGKEISGLAAASADKDTVVFHAGTQKDGNKIVTAGGRVLGVSSLGGSVDDSIKKAYEAVEKITFDRCFFRRDIGAKALKVTSVK